MSARGELYVNEECRDAFEKDLDKWFGPGRWNLKGSEYGSTWYLTDMPDVMEIDVVDDDDNVLGTVSITNRFYVEGGLGGRYIEAEPIAISLVKISKKPYCWNCGWIEPNQGIWVKDDGYIFCSGKCADKWSRSDKK